ncbi:UDP-N-acetylglucosamine--N-acetylmuramyl-(pentapeptide) pyrophosphoryl-undecaprenol N-acetylglucosamine transferase [uncultured archaeon]|nr:UDP-N-acetylglucosamine--N-acetylmuramyl-(pentapeptide) pyrophosphoryl-undecaprenol N-acetylglucosamine transferase [uncultured archaeon]
MKILFFYCGEGLGHATRAIAAANALKADHDITLASYGYTRDFGINAGLDVKEVPSEIQLVGRSGQFDLSKSILTTISNSSKQPHGILKFNSLINKTKPDLVLSDSFFLPATLSKNKGIPTWMILNQTNIERFFYTNSKAFIRMAGPFIKRLNHSTLNQMDKLLIPDFSPPFTVCEESVSLTPELYEKTQYLGPLVRNLGRELKTKPKKKTVYSMIGGFGYRKQLLDKIVEASRELPDYHFDLVAGPNAKLGTHGKNVKTYTSLTNPLPLINESSLVIGGGGHSTAMEALALGKPVLAAPDAFHCEQECNADGLERIGAGRRIDYKTSTHTLKLLIEELSTSKEYKKRVTMLKHLAEKNDGRAELVRLVREFEKEQ